jgi:hypothetical protein
MVTALKEREKCATSRINIFSSRFFSRTLQKVAHTIGKFQIDLYDGGGYVCALATWYPGRGVADEDQTAGYSWNVFVDGGVECRVGVEERTIV